MKVATPLELEIARRNETAEAQAAVAQRREHPQQMALAKASTTIARMMGARGELSLSTQLRRGKTPINALVKSRATKNVIEDNYMQQ
jgi:hypothetical protein